MEQKIIDFVNQNRLYNLQNDIPKGTQVSFILPKDKQYTNEDTLLIEVDLGFIVSHSDGKCIINYKNEEIEIDPKDILATKEQLDSMPIFDSVLGTNKIKWGNENDFINMKNRLLPDATEDEIEEIRNSIEGLNPEEGSEIVCYVSTDDLDEESGTIKSIKLGDAYFNAYTV